MIDKYFWFYFVLLPSEIILRDITSDRVSEPGFTFFWLNTVTEEFGNNIARFSKKKNFFDQKFQTRSFQIPNFKNTI